MGTAPDTQNEKEQTDPQIANTATGTIDLLSPKMDQQQKSRSTIIATQEISIAKSKKTKHSNYCPALVLNNVCPCCEEFEEEEENVCCCHCHAGHVYLCPATAENLSRTVCVADAAHNVLYSSCPQSVINHTVTYTICRNNSSTSTTDIVKVRNKQK